MTTPLLPATSAARLRKAERRQRAETVARGLYAEPVSIDGLWLLQRALCGCGCKKPLDPLAVWDEANPPDGYIVIAHVHARGSRGVHDINNVRLWRHACNVAASHREVSQIAKLKRFTPDLSGKLDPAPEPAQEPARRRKGGFQKRPAGVPSPLSKTVRRAALQAHQDAMKRREARNAD